MVLDRISESDSENTEMGRNFFKTLLGTSLNLLSNMYVPYEVPILQ